MAEVKAGSGRYKVTGYVAVVRVLDGSERYVYRGAEFDGKQADAESIKHLLSVDLIAKVKDQPSAAAAAKAEAEAKAKAEADANAEAAAAAAAEAAKTAEAAKSAK